MVKKKAQDLADMLSGCNSEEEMREIMEAHDVELRRLELNFATEKEQNLNSLKKRLLKKREERENFLLNEQRKEVGNKKNSHATTS